MAAANIDVMLLVCGFTADNQRNILTDPNQEGLEDFEAIQMMTMADIGGMLKGLRTRPGTRGGFQVGAVKAKKLKAMVWWVHKQSKLGTILDSNNFTGAELARSITEMNMDDLDAKLSTGDEVAGPGTLASTNWVAWDLGLQTYLSYLKNPEGIPLAYMLSGKPCLLLICLRRLKSV